ncbi:O-antigen ligase family protein, partial [Candidatus Calescamantes bacterium]|nr:O-antigen ligase family protein [Candidatus Calescamantes bacterium]
MERSFGIKKIIDNFLIIAIFLAFIPVGSNPFTAVKLLLISIFVLWSFFSRKQKNISYIPFLVIFPLAILLLILPSRPGIYQFCQVILFAALLSFRRDRDLLPGIRISLILISIYALLQYFSVDLAIWDFDWGSKKVFATVGNPNELGLLLLLGTLFELFSAQKRKWIFPLIYSVALIATYSKGAIGLLFLMVLLRAITSRKIMKVMLLLLPVVFLILILSIDLPWNTRGKIFKITLARIKSNPLGAGLGRFPSAYKFQLAKENKDDSLLNSRKIFVKRAHNEFLHIAVESGVLGFALFIFLYIFIVSKLLRRDNWRQYWPIYAYLLSFAFEYPLHQPLAAFFIITTLNGVLFTKTVKSKNSKAKEIAVSAVLIFVLLVNSYEVLSKFSPITHFCDRQEYVLSRAKQMDKFLPFSFAEAYLNDYFKEDVYPAHLKYLASLRLAAGDLKGAEKDLRTSISMVPEELISRKLLTDILWQQERWEELNQELFKMRRYVKNDENINFVLFVSLFNSGRFKEGIEFLRIHKLRRKDALFAYAVTGLSEELSSLVHTDVEQSQADKAKYIRDEMSRSNSSIWDNAAISELSRSVYTLEDALSPLPPVINDNPISIINPTYHYLMMIQGDIPDQRSMQILYDIFPGLEFLKEHLHIFFNVEARDLSGVEVKKFHFNIPKNTPKEKQVLTSYLFNPSKKSNLRNYYFKLRGITLENAVEIAIRHDELFGNSVSEIGWERLAYDMVVSGKWEH